MSAAPVTSCPNLAAALLAAAALIPPGHVEAVWLFPARQQGVRETGLAVLSTYAEGDPGARQRTIYTLRYQAEPAQGGALERHDELAEQGTVPPDRVERIIEGVLRRLEVPETPDVRDTDGDQARWDELLAGLRGDVLDPPYQE